MEYDFYINERNYLIIPEFNYRKYLIDLSSSDIPAMAEAIETTVQVAGTDGDIVLDTIYSPISFSIVCYTDDNLGAEQKQAEELRMSSFLNSMKNSYKKMAILSKNKMYEVKYNQQLLIENLPKCLKFTIPLKNSSGYALDLKKGELIGEGTIKSNTIKDTGVVVTIDGPALNPHIAINDYQMQYENTVLEGNKLVIDTNKSTINLVTSAGVSTNAMRYYNHNFPKIKNGENIVEVQSGITNESQVKVEWRDLKL